MGKCRVKSPGTSKGSPPSIYFLVRYGADTTEPQLTRTGSLFFFCWPTRTHPNNTHQPGGVCNKKNKPEEKRRSQEGRRQGRGRGQPTPGCPGDRNRILAFYYFSCRALVGWLALVRAVIEGTPLPSLAVACVLLLSPFPTDRPTDRPLSVSLALAL